MLFKRQQSVYNKRHIAPAKLLLIKGVLYYAESRNQRQRQRCPASPPARGSGELNVFATPALAALVEKACRQSVAPELDPGCGTVGTKLELAHNAPTPVGMMVRCESELTAVDGRKLTFSAVMYDDAGEVGRATHERFIIQNEKFQKKADAKKAAE